MRILHAVGWYFPDSLGGSELYVQNLCLASKLADHEVFVAAPTCGEPRTYNHAGTAVFRYTISATGSRSEAIGTTAVPGSDGLPRLVTELGADILHVHSIVTGIGVREIAAAKDCGAAVVVTHHLPGLGYGCRAGGLMRWGADPCDGIATPGTCSACTLHVRGLPRPLAAATASLPPAVSRLGGWLPGKLGTALGMAASIVDSQALQRQLFDVADVHVALNDTARGILIANGLAPRKVVLNRLGIGRGFARKPAPDVRPTTTPVRFAFVGRFDSAKGTTVLAEAVSRLSRDVPLELDFVGPDGGPAERAVRETTRSVVGDDPRVKFLRVVEPGSIGQLLSGYDVLCCPSTGFENGPTVALEAVACGTPVIGSRVGNLAELIDDNISGALVRPGDSVELASVMRRVALDPAATLDNWRRHLPPVRTIVEVARDYLALYEAIATRAFA